MPRIKHNVTKKVTTVSQEALNTIQSNPITKGRYTVLPEAAMPEEVKAAIDAGPVAQGNETETPAATEGTEESEQSANNNPGRTRRARPTNN